VAYVASYCAESVQKIIGDWKVMQNKDKIYKFIERMPKVELHVHLEGSIKPETVLLLAQRNNIELPIKTLADVISFFRFKDFKHFVDVFTLITSCLKAVDDYELISYQFGCECARQNIRYAEVTFSMATNCRLTGLSWQDILEALNRGRSKAKIEFGVDCGWVFDILRDEPDTQNFVADVVLNSRDKGVVALGLTGNENAATSDKFVKTFDNIRKHCFGIVPHAGETCGPESICGVIKQLHADRIGHGVRCVEDPILMDFLKQKQIPLEVCLTSNICLGIFHDFKTHSLKKLWDSGLFITINSDDPALFDTDLNNEYKILVDNFGFDLDDLEQVSLNALHASFLPDDKKLEVDQEFRAAFASLRK